MKIVIGITGSIAAYKIPFLIRDLVDQQHEVRVILTSAGKEFVTPFTLQTVSRNPIHENLFDAAAEAAMSHIELARWADIILIAPASADFIAKLAHGYANDLLSTVCLATTAKIIVAPAMNQQMWLNQITQENINILKNRDVTIWGPGAGLQACGEDGPGRMLEPEVLANCLFALENEKLLKGKRILITAGPTFEPIDPVRYIANKSSGKMGYALAEAAIQLGAQVTLISGPAHLQQPKQAHFIKITTATEMFAAVDTEIDKHDIFISAAAVADYKCVNTCNHKIKRNEKNITLELEANIDIIKTIRKKRPDLFIVGFAAETQNLLENAASKRLNKEMDLIIANDVSRSDIGFESEDNEVIVISNDEIMPLEKMAKKQLAVELLKIIHAHLNPVHTSSPATLNQE